MSVAADSMPEARRLYVGEGVTIKGEVTVPDTLVVCGTVQGDVATENLIVGETGIVKGRVVVAQNAEVSGKIFEKLDVKCLLILRATGRVDGNISYGMLQIEQGATIAGGISSTEFRPEPKAARADAPAPQEQRPPRHDSALGNSALGNGAHPVREPGLSVLEPASLSSAPGVR